LLLWRIKLSVSRVEKHWLFLALMIPDIVGVAWMLDKEKRRHMMQGGILADEMGLG
jgi:hypothetical protein